MDGFVTYDAKYRSNRGDVAGLMVLKLFAQSALMCRQSRSAPGRLCSSHASQQTDRQTHWKNSPDVHQEGSG